jgi:S-adenosylmethionine synthetase
MKKLFTSESVAEGHPDKLCDQISDAILDECLKQDTNSRVAVECFITTDYLLIGGEVSTKAKVDYEKVARWVLDHVGYHDSKTGIDAKTCQIDIRIHEQSNDIAIGVDRQDQVLGAGDQGIMFGYANRDTETYMPYAIQIAHDLVHLASKLRKNGTFTAAMPDMKSQVTMDYTNKANPRIETILMSIQHQADYDKEAFNHFVKTNIMDVIAKRHNQNTDFEVLINPTGNFVIGGPNSDTGLTGRKIIVDTYGGYSRHGGGAFSGKDATKVDRSGAYMCRYVAKNLVAAGLASEIEIQVSYAIGIAKPVSIFVETFGTENVDPKVIVKAINETFDFSVQGIIDHLSLTQPVFFRTSKYGHFGKNEFAWEKLDKVDTLRKYLK